jgi:putative addiction module component
MTKRQILKAAQNLDTEDRIDVAGQILASIEADEQRDVDDAWIKVAYARLDALKRGEMHLIDGEKALDRIHAKYAK